MGYLGLDVGTTNIKVAFFAPDGTRVSLVRVATPMETHPDGSTTMDAAALWNTCRKVLAEITDHAYDAGSEIVSIGVTGMSETGVLVDPANSSARTPFIPWFDARGTEQIGRIRGCLAERDLFVETGLKPSGKYGLAKILSLRSGSPYITDGAVWLSVADYIVYRLTGMITTCPSLAARTFAYLITENVWDGPRLRDLGLAPEHFPAVVPSLTPCGRLAAGPAAELGLRERPIAANAGHDHICAVFAAERSTDAHGADAHGADASGADASGADAGGDSPDVVLDSFGTAEAVLRPMKKRPLAEREYSSGLSFAPAIETVRLCALGGISSAGGALDWYARLGTKTRSGGSGPDELARRLAARGMEPPAPATTVPVFVPAAPRGANAGSRNASGGGSHHGRFVGLSSRHTAADAAYALLSGVCYEAERIRRAIDGISDRPARRIIFAGGGGPLLESFVRIKADVFGVPLDVLDEPELAVRGAAMVGAIAAEGGSAFMRFRPDTRRVLPDSDRHARHRFIFEKIYSPASAATAVSVMKE